MFYDYMCEECDSPFQDEEDNAIPLCSACLISEFIQTLGILGNPMILDEDEGVLYMPKGMNN